MVRDVQLQYVKNVISCLNENKVGFLLILKSTSVILVLLRYYYILNTLN